MRLSSYLKYLVDTKVYRLVDLAKDAGVYLSDLSRILNGRRPCGIRTLCKLLDVLPVEHRMQFLVLWLEDQVPAKHRDLLHIVPSGNSVTSDTLDIGTLEGAIECLKQVAGTNEAVRDLLLFLASQHRP